MNTSEIESLLTKFYEGNTSLQEEKILRDYFQRQHLPFPLKSHQPLFGYLHDEQQIELDNPDFEQRLTARLTEIPAETPVIPMHPRRSSLMLITGIAASLLLLIGLFFTFQHDAFNRKLTLANNPDAEIAYADVSEALMMVSGNLNTGLKHMERLKMVDKAMKNMQLFNKFYQVQTIIINPDEISNQSIKSK